MQQLQLLETACVGVDLVGLILDEVDVMGLSLSRSSVLEWLFAQQPIVLLRSLDYKTSSILLLMVEQTARDKGNCNPQLTESLPCGDQK